MGSMKKMLNFVSLKTVVYMAGLAVLVGCATTTSSTGPVTRLADVDGDGVVEERLTMSTEELHDYGDDDVSIDLNAGTAGDTAADWGDPLAGEYLIEAGDTLYFRSFEDSSLDQQVVVRYDGNISLPMIPDVSVDLATRSEAEERVREAYLAVLKDPQVSLNIISSTSKFFQVMGDVSQPARYPFERRMSILDAINRAGGQRVNQRSGDSFVGQQGSLSKALIIRHNKEGARVVLEYDLRGLSQPGPHESDAPVYPGDIVYVPEGVNLAYLIGEVPRPGVYALPEGASMLRLLAQSGGVIFNTGKLRKIVLLREMDDKTTEVLLVDLEHILRTGQDVELNPGDVVYVPRKDLVRLQQFVARFTGSISPILSLYTQGLRTYYDKDFIDQSLDSNTGGNDLNGIVNSLTNLVPAGFAGALTP
jgi:polysaccharide export outer membrane protein